MKKITESPSNHDHLEQMSTLDLLANMNFEDQKVALAVNEQLSSIEAFVDARFRLTRCESNSGCFAL